jgi:CBS domain-containing protein
VSCGMEALANARIDELALRPHASVGVDAAMWKVVEQMKAKDRGAVMIEDGDALVGIFTERDLLNRVDHSDPLWSHLLVRDVMTPHPMVIHADDSMSEALRRMIQGHRRHLPVVDERGRVLGVLSIRDVLTFVAERFPEDLVNLPPHPDHES